MYLVFSYKISAYKQNEILLVTIPLPSKLHCPQGRSGETSERIRPETPTMYLKGERSFHRNRTCSELSTSLIEFLGIIPCTSNVGNTDDSLDATHK